MNTVELHPFNSNDKLTRITYEKSKIILGSFPAYEVVHNPKECRFEYYYGSNDNTFWDLFLMSHDINSITQDNIIKTLDDNNFCIFDIIKRCRRKDQRSSSDNDLSIIEFEDIFRILFDYPNLKMIYFTSYYVYSLFITKILKPLLPNEHRKDNFIDYKNYKNKINRFYVPHNNSQRTADMIILPSPSPQGLRNLRGFGIIKNLDNENLRRNIYKELFNYNKNNGQHGV